MNHVRRARRAASQRRPLAPKSPPRRPGEVNVDYDDVWVDDEGDVCWIDGTSAKYLKDFGVDNEYITYSCRWMVLK